MKNSELVPVMLVRVPEISAEARTKLKAEIESSIYDGVLLLDESLSYEVVELPLPRDSPVELLEPESRPPRSPTAGMQRRSGRSLTASMPTARAQGWAALSRWPRLAAKGLHRICSAASTAGTRWCPSKCGVRSAPAWASWVCPSWTQMGDKHGRLRPYRGVPAHLC